MIKMAPGGTDSCDKSKLYRKIGLRLLPILFLAYVVATLDRNNIGFAKLGFTQNSVFTTGVYGLGGGLFYLGYILFEIPSNILLSRIGVRLTFLRIMILWTVFCTGFAFMTQPWHYYVLRFFLGAAEAGYFPGVLLYLTYWVPRSRRARFTAIFMCAMPFSGIIGAPVSGLIMDRLAGAHGLDGWRWLFIIEAVPAAFVAIIAYLMLTERPAKANWLNAAEKRMIETDLNNQGALDPAAPPEAAVPNRRVTGAYAALRNPSFYIIGAMAFALMSGLNGISLWGPTIIKASGVLNLFSIGLMASLPQIFGIAAQILNAWHSDRTSERRYHAAIPGLLAATGWLVLPSVRGSPLLSLMALGVVAIGLYAATAPFWSTPSQYLSGSSAAVGIALITTVGGIGSMVSPAIVGWLAERTGSLDVGQYFYGIVMIIGTFSFLVGTRLLSNRHSAGACP